jgi:hypothetical protein
VEFVCGLQRCAKVGEWVRWAVESMQSDVQL